MSWPAAVPASASALELICPGLLGPLPILPQPLPPTPTLDRLLGRAQRSAVAANEPEAALLAACGWRGTPERDLPTAALCLLGEQVSVAENEDWLHADPIHLRADRERLLLFAGDAIAPDRAEAEALIELFNDHFGRDGLRLLAPTPSRWYLQVTHSPALRTSPLQQVLGGALGERLPSGPDAVRWNGILNEAQMLFFASAVNRARERARRPVISGIWIWGGGRLPELAGASPALIVGDHPLSCGLARHTGARHLTPAAWRAQVVTEAGGVWYWDGLRAALNAQDLTAWVRSLTDLESCLAEVAGQLRAGALSQLVIDAGLDSRWRIARGQLRHFWHRQGLRSLLRIGQV